MKTAGKKPAGGSHQPKRKKQQQQSQQQQQPPRSVYNKRQKSRRHRKLRPWSEPDAVDQGWSPAVAGLTSDLAPGEREDRFLPRSLREVMWLKKVAALAPNDRRRYLKSRRKTNPEAGDVAGMRRAPAQSASLRRRAGESRGRHLARVERTAQQTLLTAQYADRFGDSKSGSGAKKKTVAALKRKRNSQASSSADADEAEMAADADEAEAPTKQRRRRDAGGVRPGCLEPVVSEPPKGLVQLKFRPRQQRPPVGGGAGRGGGGSGRGGGGAGRGGGGGFAFASDRIMLT